MTSLFNSDATDHLPGPRSKPIWDAMARIESSARTYAQNVRTTFVRGEGVRLFDADGKAYIDCLSGAGVLALGHNHPVVTEAIRAALDANVVVHALDMVTPAKLAFAETLLDTMPATFAERARIQFCSPSGADAVEAAVKLVKTATGRRSILAFQGAYHGMTHAGLALTGEVGPKERVPNLMPDVHFLPYPNAYRCAFGVGGDEGARLGITFLERCLDDPQSGITKPAGVIVEVVQGEGGSVPAPDWWLCELRRVTAERSIPLIVDEIQTGVGRTGSFYAFERAGITPDVVLVSKAIGGGLPLSVMLYDRALDAWTSGAHVGTFRANQLAMAAGTAVLHYVRAKDLSARAAQMGEYLVSQLRSVCDGVACVGDVRGRGLMIGVEIIREVSKDASPSFGSPPPGDPLRARRIRELCLRRGVLIEGGGRDGCVLRLIPPLILEMVDADRVVDVIAGAIRDVDVAN